MVINRNVMKRKRREECPSPILDESPKRTKVHAQRKFAQGSNVNSPVITPVKELEKQEIDVLPEPVELLPIKRPNTEDFLTFLCFRGTPILPPSLNFFNTASIVDTNGQVHEIKSESPKNGPLDTSGISKSSGSSERPFIAFGVRKRADPIVISRQMDKKRRHALALQALRRKYQEQRMAKIRAVTISKLSEKVTHKTLVRSNSVSKSETVPKKSSAVQKTKTVETAKDNKISTRSVRAALRPQLKQKMCLRSFRGRFVQKELQFRNVKKRALQVKTLGKKKIEKKEKVLSKTGGSDYSSEDEKPLSKADKKAVAAPPKVAKKSAAGPKKPVELNFRVTRSTKLVNTKIVSRRQQLKKRMLMSTPKTTIIKPRTLRSQTAQKSRVIETKQKIILKSKKKANIKEVKKELILMKQKQIKPDNAKNEHKENKKVEVNSKKEQKTEKPKKDQKVIENAVKEAKLENTKKEQLKKVVSPNPTVSKQKVEKGSSKKEHENKKGQETKKEQENKKEQDTRKGLENKKEQDAKKGQENVKKTKPIPENKNESSNVTEMKKENFLKKKPTVILRKSAPKLTEKKENDKQETNTVEEDTKKAEPHKANCDQKDNAELRVSQRPTRKTKEAAAIYMEILSHKLVNESKIDDDNVSIDSFPELPNVKKTEQRENELKAKARSTKTSESEGDNKKPSKKEKDDEVVESKGLRSKDKKKATLSATEKTIDNEDDKKPNCVKKYNVKENVSNEETNKTVVDVKKSIVKAEEEVCDRKTRSTNIDKPLEKVESPSVDRFKEAELKVHISPIYVETESKNVKENKLIKADTKIKESKEPHVETESKKVKENKESHVETESKKIKECKEPLVETETKKIRENKAPPAKKKCVKNVEAEGSYSDTSETSTKKQTSNDKNVKAKDAEVTKRQTRNSSFNIRHTNSDDSDESFRVDIRIPRKKQITRSKVKSQDSDKDNSPKTAKKSLKLYSYRECSSSESDHSTTSDVNIKLPKSHKNKKFTKTRGQQKDDQSFSDSDEEPLSKLAGTKEVATEEKEPEKKVSQEKTADNVEKESFVKPKRECAKRPQNYLPMLSSSDEDENYFHGFKAKTENNERTTKTSDSTCTHVPTTSDLSCKDIGRRFGKGKVNMSTEQIEKWLKESAMAGNSVKSENDSMLKFGEKIPTETSHSMAASIDTEKLKTLLITNLEKAQVDVTKKDTSLKPEKSEEKQSPPVKSQDRKLIFRNKARTIGIGNVKAFSANEENSVYAFGEETEDVMKTPFRRPSRRPSSTATSKSEDETSKCEDPPKFRKPVRPETKPETLEEKQPQTEETIAFYVPSQPCNKAKPTYAKVEKKYLPSTSMTPPSTNLKYPTKSSSRTLDILDDPKYKVPSSPSASSSSSAKLYKRQTSKCRAAEILPVKLPDFPVGGSCAQLVEAPTFFPTDKEFQDPLEYIEKIRSKAEQFGICRIIPPSTFKPECKVTDDMRFTAYNQYVHKMLHRWGPNFKELMAIKRYLSTQNITLTHPPWIGGMEIDLPRLYQTVQSLGGLKEVIEKKKWPKVSDVMKIPKSAQDRVTKLDDIYCKYLLPYDTLSPAEREKLFDEVETEWAKRESKSLLKAQQNIDSTEEMDSESDDEAEECIVKGRSMALNAFYRIARNTMSMWFKNQEPLAEEVEQEFWRHVTMKQNHICVHSGSIDSGNWGYGFAVSKNSPFARHAWNLKVLTNNSGSVLRSIGPVMGVTVPTLHVGMVFSSCCWYRDPHSLPWIEYLHTGGKKIWYGIPDSTSSAFHAALKAMVPNYCRNKSIWLPSDTVMVPPNLLVEHGVSLSRIVQEPGQFIIVFPKVFTSSLSTGYVVSESVYFAPSYWLKTGRTVFDEMAKNCEPSMFSFDRLLLSIVNDARSNVEVLKQIIPAVQQLCDKEKSAREKVRNLGVSVTEKLPLPEAPQVRKKKKLLNEDGEYECDICRTNLFVSMVTESQEDAVYCLEHTIELLETKKIQNKYCTLTYTYDEEELDGLIEKIQSAITNKLQKKVPSKFAGLPTLLK